MPRWDRRNAQGIIERAKLDVCFDDPQGRRVYIDVAITDAATDDVHKLRSRAAQNGAAAADKEDRKRFRYPGPDLTPFVVEALGRMGSGADALLRSFAPKDATERSVVLGAAKQSLSALVQMGNAELVLSAI